MRRETHYVVRGELKTPCGRYAIRYDASGRMTSSLEATTVLSLVTCRSCLRVLYPPRKA